MSYQVSEIFSPYFKYCAEQTACQQYCKEQDRDNQVFKAYLAVSSDVLECPSLCPSLGTHFTSNFSGVRLKEIVIV